MKNLILNVQPLPIQIEYFINFELQVNCGLCLSKYL